MEHVAARRAPAAAAASLSVGSIGVASGAAITASGALMAGAVLLLLAAFLSLVRTVPWRAVLAVLVVLVAFVPIRRYAFGTGLPFQLEPYRVFVLLVVAGWAAALFVDPHVRLRRTGFGGPMIAIAAAVLASIALNPGRVADLEEEVTKSLTFFVSFIVLFFVVSSVVRTAADSEFLIRVLVASMAVVGVLAVVESRTSFSPFEWLDSTLPLIGQPTEDVFRGSGVRVRGPAQHPIALGAVFVLVVPLAYYVAKTARSRRHWWWLALGVLIIGVLATRSRTGVLMLLAVGVMFVWLRPKDARRLWPLVLPFLAAIHFAVPGALGTVRATFFPQGGLIAEQQTVTGDCDADGRIADLGPTLREVTRRPFLGYGFGTRVIEGEKKNSCILDSQWLATLVEVGLVGTVAFAWLFVRMVRALRRAARRAGRDADLCAALAASVAAYAVSMFTYDSFTFIQVTLVLFVLMGLAASALTRSRSRDIATPGSSQPISGRV